MKKTFKREVSVVQLLLHWALVGFTVWTVVQNPDRDISALVDLCTGLAVWVYGFAGAAFGMDAWAKQVKTAQEDQPPEGYAS